MALSHNNKFLALAFTIVTYKEDYSRCKSFVSLVRSYESFGTDIPLRIVVIDNTEMELGEVYYSHRSENNITVDYFTAGVNLGISKAYNKAVTMLQDDVTHIVFLDQDTELPLNFFNRYNSVLLSAAPPIACPIIFAKNNLISPVKFKNFRPQKSDFNQYRFSEGIIDFENYSIINTGLMISIELFRELGGYDEELFLDFCDHDFIERVKEKKKEFYIISSVVLYQDLSSYTDDLEKAILRYRIFLNDLQLYSLKKVRLKIFFYIFMPHLLKLTVKYRSLAFLKLYLFNKFSKR